MKFRIWCFSAAWCLGLGASISSAASLGVEILPRFDGAPLSFDAMTNTTAAGQRLSVTRLDFLLSNIALRRADGSWFAPTHCVAYLSGRGRRTSFRVAEIPTGSFDRLRFQVGVPAPENHANPDGLAAGHPLNSNVNGLHWSWQGGYVFFALEGKWELGVPASAGNASERDLGGYSWHIATDRQLATVELPLELELMSDCELRLGLNVDRVFTGRHAIQISDATSSTHSRANDKLAGQLRENIEGAFVIETFRTALPGLKPASVANRILMAPAATPYRLTIPGFFPRPALPLDNPLTEEGVELGRRLFHEERLSINNRQTCASCHAADGAFVDTGKRYSVGAEGAIGNRNAMPLSNLAWKDSFFWDGRAASLREQVLMPIQNPIEMHETLSNVVEKLKLADAESSKARPHPGPLPQEREIRTPSSDQCYPALFARAFGTSDITPDRLARALEQFLLVQVAHDSRFDRVLKGEARLTDEEQRGFELFHTEYDPRHGQFGADCFHCHGGPLFRSQSFANNGLDAAPPDPGRSSVTGKPGDRGKFAVPSLRNVAVTAPYMHDGRFATLEEVVGHYVSGVKRSATLDPNLAKHPEGGVPLSAEDQRALVAFLRTLTEERFVANHGKLARLP